LHRHSGSPLQSDRIPVRSRSRKGKGLDLTQVMASALMEATEGFHAEKIGESLLATYRKLAAHGCRRPSSAVRGAR
jgi:ribosomal protein S12 methylthiotransferase accessory factor YcaO